MSASLVFSSAATGRPFIFPPRTSPQSFPLLAEKSAAMSARKPATNTASILARVGAFPQLAAVVPASRLEVRSAPEMVSSGIPQLDALTGGFARGCLTEICGAASSGRTSVLLHALARATERGEVCALVDSSDAFDPASAASAGMEMSRLLWVRCKDLRYKDLRCKDQCSSRKKDKTRATTGHFSRWKSQLEQMLKVTDLLLQSNGFLMIALDLGDIPAENARRIPLASWFRFRRAVEQTPTVLLVLEQQPIAGSCSSMLVRVSACSSQRSGKRPPHSELLDQFEITAELMRSRLKKPSGSQLSQLTASFTSRAAWAR